MAAAVARVVQTRTNGIPALSILSWKLIMQLHVVLVCVLDKWYFSTSYSELEVDKAVTARAALYPDLDKWYFGTSYFFLSGLFGESEQHYTQSSTIPSHTNAGYAAVCI